MATAPQPIDIATIPGPLRRILEGVDTWDAPVASITATPLSSPADGDRVLVGAGGTGVFSGRDDYLAQWDATAGAYWFFAPIEGRKVYVVAAHGYYQRGASSWAPESSGGGGGSIPNPTSFTNTGGTGATMSAGILTITHALGRKAVEVQIWDQNGVRVYPPATPNGSSSTTKVDVDMTAFQTDPAYSSGGALTGTWSYRVL